MRLIAMMSARYDNWDTHGSGIPLGRDGFELYIVTENHAVRRRDESAQDLAACL